jgi:hypothetical protein
MDVVDMEYNQGEEDVVISTDQGKNTAVKIANWIRKKYDCHIQEAGGMWYIVVMF